MWEKQLLCQLEIFNEIFVQKTSILENDNFFKFFSNDGLKMFMKLLKVLRKLKFRNFLKNIYKNRSLGL